MRLGTGLRFGEFAGLRRRRVHLDREVPVLQVAPIRYQAGKFGSGFKSRPKSPAAVRPVPLAPQVVEAIRRQLPTDNDPGDLVFTVPGTDRAPLSRHLVKHVYQKAAGRLTDRKSTRLNSSHPSISYAVFCLKKKKKTTFILLLLKKNINDKLDVR